MDTKLIAEKKVKINNNWISCFFKKYWYIVLAVALFIIYILYINQIFFIYENNVRYAEILVLGIILAFGTYLKFKDKLTVQFMTISSISIGLCLRISYIFMTSPYVRQHDVLYKGSHLEVIKYIAENMRLPDANVDMIQAYQPPLYHILAAIIYKAGILLDMQEVDILRFIQIIFVLLSCVLMVVVFRITKLLGLSLNAGLISVGIFAFHPYNIYITSFLNNDFLLMFFMILSFYALILWRNSRSTKHILFAAVAAILAFWTKKSAIIIIGVECFVLLVEFFKSRYNKKIFKQGIFYSAFVGCLAPLFTIRSWFIMNQNLNYVPTPGLPRLENDLSSLFSFNIFELLKNPYTSDPMKNVTDNNLFISYVYRSSLFGEWVFKQVNIARILMFITLVLTFLLLVFFIKRFKDCIFKDYFLTVLLLLPLIFLLKFRIDMPYACSQNFRYVELILVPLSLLAGRAYDYFKQYKHFYIALNLCVALFCIVSGIFLISI